MITNVHLVLFMLVLARVSAFIGFFPIFSRRQLPTLVKVGLAGALSIFWFLEINASVNWTEEMVNNLGGWASAALLLREVLIGIVMSVALGLFFWPAKIAGVWARPADQG